MATPKLGLPEYQMFGSIEETLFHLNILAFLLVDTTENLNEIYCTMQVAHSPGLPHEY